MQQLKRKRNLRIFKYGNVPHGTTKIEKLEGWKLTGSWDQAFGRCLLWEKEKVTWLDYIKVTVLRLCNR